MPDKTQSQTPAESKIRKDTVLEGTHLNRPPPRVKMEGKLPTPAQYESPEHSQSCEPIEGAKPWELYPERHCQSPMQILEMEAAIHVVGTELGLPHLNKEIQPEMLPRVGGPPSQSFPKIYLGDGSPTPHWLIRPDDPEIAQHASPQSASGVRRPLLLGRLRWEFEPGPPSKHTQDENLLREYAYRYLQNSLCGPIVRDELRELIWNSQHAAIVAHVEHPLPIPPPPPHFKDQRASDFVNLRPPVSASTPDGYRFMYPDYERPSLATRALRSSRTRKNRKSGVGQEDIFTTSKSDYTAATSYRFRDSSGSIGSSVAGSRRSRASTSSSGSINLKHLLPEFHDELDDDSRHHPAPNSPARTKTQSPGDIPPLSKAPKRGKGRPKRKKNAVVVDVRTLDELSSAELPPPKRRGGRKGLRSDNAWTPSSEAFSDDEKVVLPKKPKKAKAKARRGKKKAARCG
ncbi:hypothetical protein BDW62DRAFT_191984 [Aspergillus aurantiobrunneus]